MKIALNIFYWVIIALIGGFAINYMENGSSIICIVALAIGCVIAIYKSIKNENYIANTWAVKSTGRTLVYDYLRCLAVLFVIAFHNIGMDLILSPDLSGTVLYHNLDYVRWLCFTCNEIFIMISGALLIKYKDEGIIDFYKKRFLKIFIPLVVYYLFYLWHSGHYKEWSFAETFIRFITGETKTVGANNFWLIYIIIILYLFVPLLRKLFKNVSYKALSIIVLALFALLAVDFYFPTGLSVIRPYVGWFTVALLGFWCSKEETRKFDIALIVIGVISAIAMYLICKYDSNYIAAMDSLTPYRMALAVGAFGLFFKIRNCLKDFYLIRLISKYSYGIMLIHNLWVTEGYRKGIYKISSVMYKGLGGFVIVAETLVISLIFAYIIDNLIVGIFNLEFKKKNR